MKAKDLRFPYCWEERKPIIHDKILFIPNYYFGHDIWVKSGEPWTFFPNDNPIHVEFCSGNGEWVINQAISYPNINWIAVEIDFSRVRKIWSKRANQRISNLFIVCGRAQEFIKHYVTEDLFSEIFIHFPDPWPRKKQAKHRLFQHEFLLFLNSSLRRNGKLHLVTDVEIYIDASIQLIKRLPIWDYWYEWPHFIINKEKVGSSWFHRLWIEKGKDIFYMTLINKKESYSDIIKK